MEENSPIITENGQNKVQYDEQHVTAPKSVMSPLSEALDNVVTITRPITNAATQAMDKHSVWLSELSDVVSSITASYVDKLNVVTSVLEPLVAYLREIAYSPLSKLQKFFQELQLDQYFARLNNIYLEELVVARWFPVAIATKNAEFFKDIINAVDTTRKGSKNRTKKLDQVFFAFYDVDTIDDIKRYWRTKDLPNHIKRILVEAIQAYKRRQYALTLSALAPLWQGIIQEKAKGWQKGKTNNKTKQEFQSLITENDCNKFVEYYFDEYVFYPCYGIEEVKDDVPGRNSVCHSWYKAYPTRKAALNAILFTDFLLNLKPLKKGEN